MESSYGVGVRNRYDILLDEESDPNEVLEVLQKENRDEKKDLGVANKDKLKQQTNAKTKSFPAKKSGKENIEKVPFTGSKRIEDAAVQRGPKERAVKFSDFSSEVQNNRRNREEQEKTDSFTRETAPRFDGEKGRGRGGFRGGRGRGKGRGRGFGQDGFDSRGKREFDRMSGSEKSSVRSFEKREGGGAHNWGKRTDVEETLDMDNNADLKHDDSVLENSLSKDDAEKPTGVEEVSETEMNRTEEITFEEWKEKQGARQKPSFNIRKAGEGEAANWKKGYTKLVKKVESDTESDDEDDIPHGRQKQLLNINIQFSNPRGRGRRGRPFSSKGKGENSKQSAPRVDDEKDFPSL